MKGNRYYANLDFSKPIGTHRWVDNIKSRRQLAKVALVDMSDAIGKHYAPILSTHGEHFEFRIARFYNFRDIKTEEPRTIVRCLETGEVWILKPNWAQSLTRTDENTKQTIILIPQPVKNYRQILDFMKLFYSDGETMKRLISIGRIKEILK